MDTTGTLWMPPAHSTISGEVDALFYFILYVGAFLFLLVIGLTAFFALKYRHKKDSGTTYGVDHNFKLEVLWTAIPTVLVMIVFVWGFRSYLKMNVVPHEAIEIKVTGQKWFWSFDYPEGANAVNELVVPVGQPVKLLMSSKDVSIVFISPISGSRWMFCLTVIRSPGLKLPRLAIMTFFVPSFAVKDIRR